MSWFLFTLCLGAGVLYITEGYLTKKNIITPELSRKLIHMAHGLAAASWPFFISYETIIIAELGFLAVAIVAKKLGWFRGLNAINRLSWGELAFPLGVIASAVIAPPAWVFAVAMLHVGLADAFAALVGKNYGKHQFKIFGQKKSIEGSATFFTVSCLTMMLLILFAPIEVVLTLPIIVAVPVLSTAAEAAAPFGMDNFVIPVLVVALLSL